MKKTLGCVLLVSMLFAVASCEGKHSATASDNDEQLRRQTEVFFSGSQVEPAEIVESTLIADQPSPTADQLDNTREPQLSLVPYDPDMDSELLSLFYIADLYEISGLLVPPLENIGIQISLTKFTDFANDVFF